MIVFESEFILRFAGIIIHQFRLAFVVVGVFLDLVLQGTATEYEKVVPTVPVMFVGNSKRVTPLHALRQEQRACGNLCLPPDGNSGWK